MKKTIMAVATTCFLLSTQAFASSELVEQENQIEVPLEPIQVKEEKFENLSDDVFQSCLSFSQMIGESLGSKIKKEYDINCSSVAFAQQNIENNKEIILDKITKKDFDSRILISTSEIDYVSNVNLIASFLIESPMEKQQIIKYFKTEAQNQSPEEIRKVLDKLDIKYKPFKIDKVFYKNLIAAHKVLVNDKERILSIRKNYNEKIINLALERAREVPDSQEDAALLVELLHRDDEAFDTIFTPQIELRLKNLGKYLQSLESANRVYGVFNRKNPLFVAKLPTYTKAECKVLDDWGLGELAKEKFQVNKIPGCK